MNGSLRNKLIAAGFAGAALVGLVGAPAQAADTTTTFALTGGALSVSAPANATLSSAATGATSLSSQLGSTTVTDARGALLGSWTASVVAGDFTTGASTANETILKSRVDYWSGVATASSGTAVFTPGQLLVANKVTIGTSQTAYGAAAIVGNNSATWNPTLVVNPQSSAVAGTYTGTVTHSIA